jgi:hypothetical protein
MTSDRQRIDLRHGDWRLVLDSAPDVDAVICDPPYGARTHAGQTTASADGADRRDLSYAAWTPDDVRWFVKHWSARCRGWIVALTSDDLIAVWRAAYADVGRLDFAPVPVIQDRVRMTGDGPASCAVYLMAARPRRREFLSWGALPGWYRATTERAGHIGGKPLSLMSRLVTDYSRPGQLVCDPCAGYGTTLVAAYQTGRRAIGAEIEHATWQAASERVAATLRQPLLFTDEASAEQIDLW